MRSSHYIYCNDKHSVVLPYFPNIIEIIPANEPTAFCLGLIDLVKSTVCSICTENKMQC